MIFCLQNILNYEPNKSIDKVNKFCNFF